MPRTPSSKLTRIVAALRAAYGSVAPPPARTAFELVLWEKVAYLADDERRARAFEALRRRVGLTPQAILSAPMAELREIAAIGGPVGVLERAQRMRDAAELVMGEFNGSLDDAARRPLAEARKAMRKIYGIAEPGADKILLLTRAHLCFPLDSNGARVLCRIGYGADDKNYTKMYKSVVAAALPEAPMDFDWLIDAHVLLRHHGQETCKTSSPHCEMCVVRRDCATGNRAASAPRSRAPRSPAPPRAPRA